MDDGWVVFALALALPLAFVVAFPLAFVVAFGFITGLTTSPGVNEV